MDFSAFTISRLEMSTLITAIMGGLIIVGFATKLVKRRTYDVDQLKKPPGAHWLWGHEREAWETPNAEWYTRNTDQYGLVLAMKSALFHSDILAVFDPAALHHIFTDTRRYAKGPVQQYWFERLLGRGLTWAEGAEHTRQRQLAAPYFTAARVKRMDDNVQTATEFFINTFRQHIISSQDFSPTDGLRLNVIPWITRPTLDIIGKATLGYDFDHGESIEAGKIHEAYKEAISASMALPAFIVPAVQRAAPWIGSLPLNIFQAQGTVKTIVKEISRKILEEMKLAGDDYVHSRDDFLGKLVQTTDANNPEDVDIMLDQICVIVMAGHETSTNTASLTLMELARNPEIQTALRKEIVEFGGSGTLSYEDVLGTSLPLLDAVCKETLRMWPVGSHLERMATEDDVIPLRFPLVTKTGGTLNAIRVKKGQMFCFPILTINSNKQVWGDDGRRFNPYRWIEPGGLPPSSSLTGGIDGHFAFIEGPRLCVGYRLAIFELKVILGALIRNFEFKTTADTIDTMWATTLQPFVRGQRQAGPQLPLFVKPIHT